MSASRRRLWRVVPIPQARTRNAQITSATPCTSRIIGVPIVIAILTFCSYHPATRFITDLFGGPAPAAVVGSRTNDA
jgi:hypothetical protein